MNFARSFADGFAKAVAAGMFFALFCVSAGAFARVAAALVLLGWRFTA